MKLIHTVNGSNGTARVYRDSDWDEYRVTYTSPDGRKHPGASHHTDCRQDALSTARHMVSALQSEPQQEVA